MKKKILIVDDSESIRLINKQIIELWSDYEVDTASDGRQALDKVRTNPPDLILLDIMMPELHGYNVCQEIKSSEKYKNIKIVVLSGKGYRSDIEKAKKIGADEYLIKSVGPDIIRETIEKLLKDKNNNIRIKFYGTRGSISTPGHNYEKYGGNTSCIDLRIDNHLIILDAGTGIRELGLSLLEEFKEEQIKGNILITHTHWDHIQGFPFFLSAYNPKNIFTIYGPKGADRSLEETFQGQFESNYFPISLDEVLAKLKFVDLIEGEIKIGDIKITSIYLNHPGMTLGYKIEYAGKSLVYATDNEILSPDTFNNDDINANKLKNFIEGVDLLITDTQFTDEEYKTKMNWGHSPLGAVLELAIEAEVKSLVLFHHDPMHTDDIIDEMEEEAKHLISKHNSKIKCVAAREKQEINI